MNKVTLFLWTTLKDAKNNDPTVQADKQGVNPIEEDVIGYLSWMAYDIIRGHPPRDSMRCINKIFWTLVLIFC